MHPRGRSKTYIALQNAEPSLENVHDGIVNSFPMVDHIIVVDARNHKGRGIICALPNPFVDILIVIPSLRLREVLLGLDDTSQKLDVSTGEEIEPTIHVHDSLAGLRSNAFEQFPERPL